MRHYIITDAEKVKFRHDPERVVLTPTEFIAQAGIMGLEKKPTRVRVINLCGTYDYLSKGYYVSLMAEARGYRCIPDVGVALELNWKRIYQDNLTGLNEHLQKTFKEPEGGFPSRKFHIYFGRTLSETLGDVGRRIFDTFRCPILEVEIRHKAKWEIISIEPLSITSLNTEQWAEFQKALDAFTGSAWVNPKATKKARRWIAILHDPNAKFAPSNAAALKKFIQAADALGADAELITRQDFTHLMEYDALFIREDTAIAHHTYRFARKAESEGIPVIDDPSSIMRCCNKVYMFELLNAHKVPTPKTVILDRKMMKSHSETADYPFVLKLPEGSFSRGVFKVSDPDEAMKKANQLFEESDIILAQEFMPSEFDWRIGVLNGKPIYACQYFMAKNHWQVVNHGSKNKKGESAEGDSRTLRIEDVPTEVVDVAVKAANLIGNSLYGVDLKQNKSGVYVIEVNDNPNIDSGYKGAEDEILGMELYRTIIAEILRRVEES